MFGSQICTLTLNLRPEIGTTYAILKFHSNNVNISEKKKKKKKQKKKTMNKRKVFKICLQVAYPTYIFLNNLHSFLLCGKSENI